ncbi:hypothetical protein IAG43_08555 [Streptomyces genisteinicus]|uniref:DNA-directed RNA polymerase specialized sigma24 family protein n=1 Tax=Streptomyces genisteinicus TaxID=2768068 RepID=A0A7H0I3D6_9ACTN|nr:hypothetical protein IAG43_08555 [Streptomyces genisteinicus]
MLEAESAAHYPRLVRIAYLVLPPASDPVRRVMAAHALVRWTLPGRGAGAPAPLVPRARRPGETAPDGYDALRTRLLRRALRADRRPLPLLPLPRVRGLRLLPRAGGAAETALDRELAALGPAGRAACVLRRLEGLGRTQTLDVLAAAGATDPGAALAAVDAVPDAAGTAALLASPAFDACALQACPTGPPRRGRRVRAGVVAVAALAVCGGLLGLPDAGSPAWRDADRAAPVRAAPTAWRDATRRDFSVWPARGGLTGDRALLDRALAAWADPGGRVRVTATPGTSSGPPAGRPRLLFAGAVERARVVVLHDGLRAVRYAEPAGRAGGAALDFARTDAADGASAAALVVARPGGRVRYLTAPWVRQVSVRDLLDPAAPARPLARDASGVTAALPSPAREGACRSWEALEVRDGEGTRLLTDLGELAPVRLLSGPPSAPSDATGPGAPATWARTACSLQGLRAHGVREVSVWRYALQRLPEANGTAAWVCTRAETWRGDGARVMAQFHPPADRPSAPGTVVARAEGSPACGVREPRVLAGVLWQSRAGQWYALAAGGGRFRSVALSGGVSGEADGPLLAVRSRPGARADLHGRLPDGTRVAPLR